MSVHTIDNLELNEKGYLAGFSEWNEEVAKTLAERVGLELTDCHWRVIGYLRSYYGDYKVAPSAREVLKAVGEHIADGRKCTTRMLEELFAAGGCKSACLIAGLPMHFCRPG